MIVFIIHGTEGVVYMLISKYGNGTLKLVESFENKYSIELDEQYHRFLIKYNGGDTPKTTVRIRCGNRSMRNTRILFRKKSL